MSIKLFAATGIALAMAGLVGGLEINDAARYRYVQATVLEVSPRDCGVSNEKWRVVFRTKYSVSGVGCALAEMLVGYDDDMKGGEISYRHQVKVSYLDPADGKTKEHSFQPSVRFTVKPGGTILIRAHATKPGVVNSGRWTEDLSRLPGGA